MFCCEFCLCRDPRGAWHGRMVTESNKWRRPGGDSPKVIPTPFWSCVPHYLLSISSSRMLPLWLSLSSAAILHLSASTFLPCLSLAPCLSAFYHPTSRTNVDSAHVFHSRCNHCDAFVSAHLPQGLFSEGQRAFIKQTWIYDYHGSKSQHDDMKEASIYLFLILHLNGLVFWLISNTAADLVLSKYYISYLPWFLLALDHSLSYCRRQNYLVLNPDAELRPNMCMWLTAPMASKSHSSKWM